MRNPTQASYLEKKTFIQEKFESISFCLLKAYSHNKEAKYLYESGNLEASHYHSQIVEIFTSNISVNFTKLVNNDPAQKGESKTTLF